MNLLKRILFLMLICLSCVVVKAQPERPAAEIDLGFVDRFHNRLIDTYLVNDSGESWTLLRWNKPHTMDVKVSSRETIPGDTLFIRMKLNPTTKGPYKDEVELLFAQKIVTYDIKANVRHVDLSSNVPCPDFEAGSSGNSNWKAGFKVIDRNTRLPISDALITISGMKGGEWKMRSDKDGEAESEPDLDYYLMEVSAKGYASYHLETYINAHQNTFVMELMKGSGATVSRRPGSGVNLQTTKTEPAEEVPAEEVVDVPPIEEVQVVEEIPEENKPSSEFNEEVYKFNNITFLIDVSTSMRQGDKMDILRLAMSELVMMLRPDDRVSIITYASNTRVLESGISGARQEQLLTRIAELEAEGLTAGEAGLKKAYAINKKYFIDQGNNQVYLITDGALSKGYEKVTKLAHSQAQKEIHLSVIAISAKKWTTKQMESLAETGKGDFLAVDSPEEAVSSLKNSVKEQSFKEP